MGHTLEGGVLGGCSLMGAPPDRGGGYTALGVRGMESAAGSLPRPTVFFPPLELSYGTYCEWLGT